ncbi:MAG: shikimate dehydrogenase [Solirubrobacteraceae bacterium]|nr:shikimate dehydrogenase [Solirubrobacteraceae bacterium]
MTQPPAAGPRYGVVGWPVSHSRSPAMHQALGLDYGLLPVPPDRAEAVLRALPASGFAGVNVTIPHKGAALAVADEVSDAARDIGAANTLIYGPGGSIKADNTDAPGLLATLEGRPRASAVVLGAGGSARAIVWALVSIGCDVVVWNRTTARAQELTASLGGTALDLEAESGLVPEADVLVNCTAAELDDSSSGLTGLPLTPDHLARYATVVDLAYKPGGTVLTALAAERTTVVDGLEILVQQGARSFEMWTGRPADVAVMRSAVRNKEDHGAAYDPPGGRPFS